jgi:pimeloyl-ACP methyl ester carboxylesterase
LSDRLNDIAEYTVDRHVADLEAIRQQIGAEQMMLAGTSWGSVLAAHYMAAFPNHTARVIFMSPGVLGDRRNVRYDYKRTAASDYDSILLPTLRFVIAGALARINPHAAQAFASQNEMDRLYDTFITGPGVEYQVNCKGYQPDLAKQTRSEGANYYVNLLTLQSLKKKPDPRPALRTNHTPALIVRGECDYIPWEATYSYKETLPDAELVVIPQAGHAVTSGQAQLVLTVILAFLSGQPLPIEPYLSSEAPK